MILDITSLQYLIISIFPTLSAIVVHEVAHGCAASALGDKTAKIFGRLTLNPIKHIDLLGTIIVPITMFFLNSKTLLGWAKPMPINPQNLRYYRRDIAIIAASGPLVNFIMALLWGAIYKATLVISFYFNVPEFNTIHYMSLIGMFVNLLLMLINLLPIPQFDGWHIIASSLPNRIVKKVERSFFYIGIVTLFILLFSGTGKMAIFSVAYKLSAFINYIFRIPSPTYYF